MQCHLLQKKKIVQNKELIENDRLLQRKRTKNSLLKKHTVDDSTSKNQQTITSTDTMLIILDRARKDEKDDQGIGEISLTSREPQY